MSLKERFPRLTPLRVVVLVVVIAVAATGLILGGHSGWIVGIIAGLAVAVSSTLGTRWRNQDAERAEEHPET
jgi:membrane protein YqaA with SNARE-associated domain